MKLGVRAHDFGTLPVDELAAEIARHGLSCIQLAPAKALAGFGPSLEALNPRSAQEVRTALQRHGITVSVVGCYINLGDRDEAQRRPQLERFKAHLRFARDLGCSVVGTETGSLNSDFSRHPDNDGEEAYRIVLESVRELVGEAAACGVVVGIEAVERYVISSPRRLRRLLDDVNSPHLRVIYDPVNLLCAANHAQQDAIMAEAHTLLGDRMRIVHAKDFAVVEGRFEERPAGQGQLHYRSLMQWLKQQHPATDILLENTHPSTIAQTVAFMRDAWNAS
jgi:sugar phosphate isomerase/epimerase